MVEEIRTYLLNDPAFASVVYFPAGYSPVALPQPFSAFRAALIGDSTSDSLALKAWRANMFISAIYRDPVLAPIAESLFDTRHVPNKSLLPATLDPQITTDSVQPNLMISTLNLGSSFDGINLKNINLTLPSGAGPYTSLNAIVSTNGVVISQPTLNFTFSGQMAPFQTVPGTPVQVAFSNCTSIPSSFSSINIAVQYPNTLNFATTLDKVYQIPSVENMIYLNSISSGALASTYTSLSRKHQRLLCLLIAYACSLKNQ